MKLEPNMYVRTKWGIAKYIHNLVTKEQFYSMEYRSGDDE